MRDRRAQTSHQILVAAQSLANARGWDGWTMRELAAEVGMRAPSLYEYFAGKAAILDALFEQGYQQMDAELASVAENQRSAPDRERLIALLSTWVRFGMADPARYRLMFTASVPGWHPSEQAYAASQRSMAMMVDHLAQVGITPGAPLDLFTALGAGLLAQQMANDPGGDRWSRLAPDAIDMILQHISQPEEIR